MQSSWYKKKRLRNSLLRTQPTIEVGVEEKAYDFADGLAEGPIVGTRVVVDEEGQREDVQGVAHGQVEHVDGGRGPALCVEQDDE